jgi:hypothetical protein
MSIGIALEALQSQIFGHYFDVAGKPPQSRVGSPAAAAVKEAQRLQPPKEEFYQRREGNPLAAVLIPPIFLDAQRGQQVKGNLPHLIVAFLLHILESHGCEVMAQDFLLGAKDDISIVTAAIGDAE